MSRIHLIAPSGYCINQAAALRGIQRLEAAGHHVENQQVIARRDSRFAGNDVERLADLNALVTLDTANTIVMPVRGGYGASRLLEEIDWQGLAERQRHAPLLICGHSDFTAVQLGLLATENVITFSGPMLAANFGAEALDDFTQAHFWRALCNETFTVTWEGDGPGCDVEGTLWGGNLAMLVSLIGTPWLPAIENGILVVEDINEHPFRVERMLLQLHHAGILSRQKALILGSFSRSAPNDYDAGFDLDAMIAYLRTRLTIPVVSGLAFGHEPQTVTLPLGAQARLQHQDFNTQLTLNGHPVLRE
ncbi:muramoyltetrapeptide carboxypeptidase [Pseudescherichia vulneris]|uniref:muramoyltetrapeptide carboxypeptidase n=1 Tax=Pseudescherichia vulneris TaxID=566 RepID=UPI0012AB7270|nr:muramoyltetrapeptide carboxypeptidase [Pseudescherichia vulneris]MDU5453684.1 muramoyltetrapeptide carboxypeptidase [Pseudescherichia vulneris]